MLHRATSSVHAALCLALCSLVPGAARAADDASQQTCVEDYGATQELRLSGKLLEAMRHARSCSRPTCPGVVRDGCTKWLTEIRDAVPSIAVVARGPDGRDRSSVSVFVDGKLVAERLTGRAIELDPGEHQLRFEHEGDAPVEQTVVLSEGMKNRAVEVAFGGDPETPRGGTSPDAGEPEEEPVPAGAIVLTTVGGAALVAFAVLAGLGTKEVNDLAASCGQTHSCSESEIAPARSKIIAGDVLLGIGAAAGAFGLGWLIHHYASSSGEEGSSDRAISFGVGPSPHGLAAAVGGRF
jgi:hypothetical protein